MMIELVNCPIFGQFTEFVKLMDLKLHEKLLLERIMQLLDIVVLCKFHEFGNS